MRRTRYRNLEATLNAILDDTRAAELTIEEAASLLALGRAVDVEKLIDSGRELLRLLTRLQRVQAEQLEEIRSDQREAEEERDQAAEYASDLEKQLEEETARANNLEDELTALKEQQQQAQKKPRKKS